MLGRAPGDRYRSFLAHVLFLCLLWFCAPATSVTGQERRVVFLTPYAAPDRAVSPPLPAAKEASTGPEVLQQPPAPVPALLPKCANEATTPGPTLTCADLEKLALENNPTIPGALAQVQQQQGLLRQAGLYPNPTLGYVRSDPDQSGQSRTVGAFFSQDIVTAGKLRLGQAAARREVERTSRLLDAQQLRVLNDVRIRFYEVLGAQQAVNTALELEKVALEGVQTAEQLLRARVGSRPDVLQAELQLSAVRTTVQDARYRAEAAWRQLAAVVGVPNLPTATLLGNLEGDVPHFEWEESRQHLLAASPLLQAQQAEIQAAEYELKLARAQAYPNVNVQVVAQRDNVEKFSSVSTLVAVPVPIFNRNQGNINNAEGRLLQQKKEYERIQLALVDQLAVAFRQYQSLRGQTERIRQDILPRAQENLELTTQAYRAGRFDFLRVLNARHLYFQNRLAYLDALTELHKVGIEIAGFQLTGGLNPTEAGTALQSAAGGGTTNLRGVLLQQLQEQRGGTSRTLPGAIQAGER